jgi:anti-sigma regulatory factor (Ser/Thr protein kinase)
MRAVEVRDASQVAEARRYAVMESRSLGFDEQDAGRVAIVSTELATNLIKHGKGGTLLIGSFDDSTGHGVECLALDNGEGIADILTSKRDGHSTAGSAGNGLGAVFRGSHSVDIFTAPGCGTAILARLQVGKPPSDAQQAYPDHGAVNLAIEGEEISGDAWSRRKDPHGFSVMLADGLGHGPLAAEASRAAIRSFGQARDGIPSSTLAEMHRALKPTRGAAVAIAKVDLDQSTIVFAGVGNVAATIVDSTGHARRLVSNNGTIGHIARHMRDHSYPVEEPSLLIMASDGLGTSWRLDSYPGLASRHPALIAAVLFRDFNRGRDDVTIFVARLGKA